MAAAEAAIGRLKVTQAGGTTEVPPIACKEGGASQAYELPSQIASEPAGELVSVLIMTDLPQPPRPTQVKLGVLKDPQLRLRKPITLDLSKEEAEIIVNWPEISEFGQGATTAAAIDDFGQVLRELHGQLFASNAQLGEDLQHVKQVLAEYIEPRGR